MSSFDAHPPKDQKERLDLLISKCLDFFLDVFALEKSKDTVIFTDGLLIALYAAAKHFHALCETRFGKSANTESEFTTILTKYFNDIFLRKLFADASADFAAKIVEVEEQLAASNTRGDQENEPEWILWRGFESIAPHVVFKSEYPELRERMANIVGEISLLNISGNETAYMQKPCNGLQAALKKIADSPVRQRDASDLVIACTEFLLIVFEYDGWTVEERSLGTVYAAVRRCHMLCAKQFGYHDTRFLPALNVLYALIFAHAIQTGGSIPFAEQLRKTETQIQEDTVQVRMTCHPERILSEIFSSLKKVMIWEALDADTKKCLEEMATQIQSLCDNLNSELYRDLVTTVNALTSPHILTPKERYQARFFDDISVISAHNGSDISCAVRLTRSSLDVKIRVNPYFFTSN